MESADENDALPVLRSMTGVWALDASRSESLEPLFTAMGVSWLARKLVKNLKIQVQMVHERDSLILCETSVFGTFSTGSLVLDGRSRPVLQVDRIARPMRCRWSQPSAQLTLETVYPTGALVDRRQLQSRTEYRQTLTFQGVTVTRFFTLEETREEQVAAEKAEEAARIALAYQSATMSLLHPQPPSPVEEAEAVDQKTENSAAASSGRSNTGPGLTPGADEPASEPPLFSLTADFSGCWILDKSRSDTLDPMLTLMGLPWIARKIANSLEITVVIKHEVQQGKMVAEDHSSMGITPNHYQFDGEPRTIKSKDGKSSTVTAEVVQIPWPIPSSGPLAAPVKDASELERNPTQGAVSGCIRIVTLLPDGAGETTDTRCLIEEGRVLRQHLLYKKDGKQASIVRYLQNREYDKGRFLASVDALGKSFSGKQGTGAVTITPEPALPPSAAAGSGALPEAPRGRSHSVTSTSSSTVSGSTPLGASGDSGLDPFFVSLSGSWVPSPSPSSHSSDVSLDGLWKSLGAGWLSRKIAGSLEITYKVTHSKTSFATEDKSSLGSFCQTFKLDGRWRPVRQVDGRWFLSRCVQISGIGDKGGNWLGELGWVPKAWRQGRAGIVGSAIDAESAFRSEGAAKIFRSASVGSESDASSSFSEDGNQESDGDEGGQSSPAIPPLPTSPSPSLPAAHAIPLPKLPAVGHRAAQSGITMDRPDGTAAAAPLTISRLSAALPSASVQLATDTRPKRAPSKRLQRANPLLSLAKAVRGPGVLLKRFPVKAGALSVAEVTIETVLSDVSSEKEALLAMADDLSSDGPAPSSSAPRLVVDYVMDRRSSLSVTYRHIGADGTVLYTLTRDLQRKETQAERTMGEVADAARVQHACTLIVSRRAALDEMKAAFFQKLKEISEERKKAAEAESPSLGGSIESSLGGSEAMRKRPLGPPAGNDAEEDSDDEELSLEGAQCIIA